MAERPGMWDENETAASAPATGTVPFNVQFVAAGWAETHEGASDFARNLRNNLEQLVDALPGVHVEVSAVDVGADPARPLDTTGPEDPSA